MRTMNTFIFFLFAGILSSAILVHGQFPSQQDGMTSNFLMVLRTPEQEMLIKRECERNGGPDAYVNLKRKEVMLNECIRSAVETLNPENRTKNAELEFLATNFCAKVSNFKNCITYYTEPWRTCFQPKYRDDMNVTHNMIISLMDFICEDEGHRIREFFDNDGENCLKSKSTAMINCIQNVSSDYVSPEDAGTFPNPFSIEQCTLVVKYQRCIVKNLKECRNSTPADLMDSIFEFIKQVTPCGKLLKSHSSSADGNVSLIAGPTAITMSPVRLT